MAAMEPPVPPLEFTQPRQRRLHDQLARLGPGPAALYRDACRFFDGLIAAENAAHLAAHLQRELKSSVQEVLVPLDFAKPKEGAGKAAIAAILETFHLPPDHEIAALWDALNLHGFAHRDALNAPRPLDAFREDWEQFQRLLGLLLDAFDEAYSAAYQKLDALLAKGHPGIKDVKVLRNSIPNNPATYAYFFGRVQGRPWFDALRGTDMFSTPPAGGTWPQLAYLRRVAAVYPAEVQAILLTTARTANEFVQMEMISVAKELPPGLAVPLLLRVVADVTASPRTDSFIAKELADAVAAFVATHTPDVLRAFAALLVLRPASQPPRASYFGSQVLVGLWEEHTYGEVVDAMKVVITAEPQAAFDMLTALVEAAIRAEYGDKPGDDYSKGWMPAIEPHEQNEYYEPLPHLIEALRDAAERAASVDAASAERVITELETRGWGLFRRLALHLTRLALPPTHAAVQARVVSRRAISDYETRHEYRLLIEHAFPHLSVANQMMVAEWIFEGPEIDDECFESPAQKREYVRQWQLQRLTPIAAHLAPSLRARYDELLQGDEPPDESAEFDGYASPMWVGPTSPKEEAELAAMPVNDVLSYLRTWIPPTGILVNSREGLGRVLEKAVASRGADYAREAMRFIGLDATYVRSVVEGLTAAVKSGIPLAWSSVLTLCRWVVTQPRTITDDVSDGMDDDSHWGWTRTAITRLLEGGFRAGEAQIPMACRAEVWSVLEPITSDPDPDVAHDEELRDPHMVAINSARGCAMRAVVQYAIWVRGGVRPPTEGAPDFHDLPEVDEVLTRHLDITIDASLAVRAVYGEFFFFLHRLAPSWVSTHMVSLFPADTPALADAVWQTYLVVGRYSSKEIMRLLASQYTQAVERLAVGGSVLYSSYLRSIARHVIETYVDGDVEISPGTLIDRFFACADLPTRTYALGLVPQLFPQMKTEQVSGARERAVALWAWRAAISTHSDEFRAFGYWVEQDAFDVRWRLEQLCVAIEHGGIPVHNFRVMQTLAAYAGTETELAVRCLRGLVDHATDHKQLYRLAYHGEVTTVLETALQSGNAAVRSQGLALANVLVARGFPQLLDLVRNVRKSSD